MKVITESSVPLRHIPAFDSPEQGIALQAPCAVHLCHLVLICATSIVHTPVHSPGAGCTASLELKIVKSALHGYTAVPILFPLRDI